MTPKRLALGFMALAIITLGPVSISSGQGMKGLIDRSIREIRGAQNPDGSYGTTAEQPDATALVLLALATSPRQYTYTDGPFVRNASEWLAGAQAEDGSFAPATHGDVKRSTALATAALLRINASRYARNISSARAFLSHLLAKEDGDITPQAQFVLPLALGETSDFSWLDTTGTQDAETLLFASAGCALARQKIPAAPGRGWLEWLANETERNVGVTDAKHFSLKILAASVLFEHLEEQGTPPPLWADRIGGMIAEMMPAAADQEWNPQDAATLVSALSLCARSGQTAPPPVAAHGEAPPLPPVLSEPLPLREAVALSLDFLAANQNEGRFGFMGIEDPGITAMALSATIRGARILGREAPAHVKPGLDYLHSLKKEDGSVYLTGLKTYVTSVALMAFKDSGDPAYGPAAEAAAEFLIAVQSDEGEGYSMEEDPFYGGMGYGGDERPDLSNTQMALDALKASELDERHAAFRKALRFIEKCQNKAETNPTEVVLSDGRKVVAGTDGGGVYYPGNSKAGLEEIDEGVFVARSYGSMTYALLKSLIFTGLDEKDKRVQAAFKWVRNNYTLDENPGFQTQDDPDAGHQGLFYYYLTMARALDALGKDVITDGAGVDHEWRKELAAKVLSLQRTDGSWINERSPRWFEGNPVLATSYALLVLDVCSR